MIKIFKSNEASIAFSTESLNFYPLPARVPDYLSSDEVPTSEKSPETSNDHHIDENQLSITGLVLLVTQRCNLKCSYCFARTYVGSYSDHQIMSPATAVLAIEKVFRDFPEAPWVQFFGGEPLIGFSTIKKAVLAFEGYRTANRTQIPAFSVATNGILLNREMVDFFKEHHLAVTVSLDGPQQVNDKQRQFPSGEGTYCIVKEKIDLLRSAGVEVGINAVFTDNHNSFKETIESTYDFLLKCGARDVCLTPAIGVPRNRFLDGDFLTNLERSYTASTERIMDSWLTDSPIRLTYWLDILNTLISRKGRTHFCGAGFKTITVDCSGNVFPCHMLISDRLYMGNIYDEDFPGWDFRRVAALMRQTSKNSFSKCVKCWAKKLCSLCYGDSFPTCGVLTAPRENMCVIVRSVARATLLKIAEFMADEEKWKRFVQSVNSSIRGFDIECRDRPLQT